jgi:3',5'-cyclic AMP phosphodiesterase CpdA
MRVAVISDLHIGRKARALDLCPHDLKPEQQVGLIRDYIKTFSEYVTSKEFQLSGPVNALCVTGDISNEADPEEFKLAHAVVSSIAEALEVAPNRVYYVPGNHDVHWPVMKLEPTEFWRKYRFDPLLQEGLIFKSRMTDAATGAFHESPHFVAWQTEDLLVVGINSAASDGPVPEYGEHNGIIHQETLNALNTFLTTTQHDNNQIRICLLHHHPINYSDFQTTIPDYSIAINADNLFQLLSAHRFDVIIHGHKHVPQLRHTAAVSNGHPLTVLGAGSFSARLDSQWVGAAQNQFHIIEIEGRDPATLGAFGHVATWDFSAGKWIESHSRMGLCATESFGSLSTAHELIAEISPYVVPIINNNRICHWTDLVAKAPRLSRSSTKVAYEVLLSLAKLQDLEHFGEMDTPGRKWGLYRR